MRQALPLIVALIVPPALIAAQDSQPTRAPDPPTQAEGFTPPRPAAAAERTNERYQMVLGQIAEPPQSRTRVTDDKVLDAMRAVPRHVFVPKTKRPYAYRDWPLPIGEGQTISQPYMVACMTELLGIGPGAKVLEIGTGSGYQAAVLAHLTPHVYSIEIVEPLHATASQVLHEQGYDQVTLKAGDGYYGWAEHAPFDAIIVTCAAGHLPPALWEQIKPGGRIVIPIGGPFEVQRLVVVTKSEHGTRRSKTIMPVRFGPMTGKAGEGEAGR